MPAPAAAEAVLGRVLGSGVAQPERPQFSGSGVTTGSVVQLAVPHKLSAFAGLVSPTTKSMRSAVLTSFSSPSVGRTQPMLLHSADACVLTRTRRTANEINTTIVLPSVIENGTAGLRVNRTSEASKLRTVASRPELGPKRIPLRSTAGTSII